MVWQQELNVEAEVARRMGDPDWEELIAEGDEDDGCSRKATCEVEREAREEAEPITLKHNRFFDHR